MSQLLRRAQSLPRIVQWIAAALVVLVGYFAIVEPGLNMMGKYRDQAAKLEQSLSRDRQLKDPESDDARLLREVKSKLGSPTRPDASTATAETLYRVVNRILAEHNIEGASIGERSDQLRAETDIKSMLADSGGDRMDRLGLEVSFESDPLTAIDVLSAFEQSADISAVSRVRLDKVSARGENASATELLRVSFIPELWLAARPGGSGGSN